MKRSLVILILLLAGCGGEPESVSLPLVAVSVPPQAFFVSKIAGGLVNVEVMIPPGANPATYEPTFRQMRALAGASLYVRVGHPNFPFEQAWLDRIISDCPHLRTIDGSEGAPRLIGDPHVWVSPRAVRIMAGNITRALREMLPRNEDELEHNLTAFTAEIDSVDAMIKRILAPERGKRFYVFHPAWGYFARDYGLEQVPIEQGSKEPTPERLAALIEEARADGVRVIFVQPQFPPAAAQQVAREIGGVVQPIDPLAYDWLSNIVEVAETFHRAWVES